MAEWTELLPWVSGGHSGRSKVELSIVGKSKSDNATTGWTLEPLMNNTGVLVVSKECFANELN